MSEDLTGVATPRPGWQLVGGLVVAIYVAEATAAFWAERSISAYPPNAPLVMDRGLLLGFGWFALLGAVVVSRRPGNPMGWLLVAVALPLAIFATAHNVAAYLVLERGSDPTLPIALLAWHLRIYPEGEVVALGVNPFAAWPGAGLLRAVAAVAFASLVQRYWRGTLEERRQIRWVVAAAGTFVATFSLLFGSELLFRLVLPESLWDGLLGSAVALTPVAIGVAILRHRLYDIDRIVSRVVAYTLLTLMLVGVDAVVVVLLGGLVRAATAGGGGDLVVAASTLAVAALLGPLRRRVQLTVGRRFNRAYHDRQATLEWSAQQLRSEVGLVALASEIRAAAVRAVQPTQGSLWLANKETR